MRNLWITIGAMAIGGALGVAYWHWFGCSNGCAITSVWWRSGLYGAVMGYLVVGMVRK
jgi:hypothetical protein